MNKFATLLLALLVLGAVPAIAEEASAGVSWGALDESSQALLAGQKDRWDSLPPERQRAMAEGAKRWLEMGGVGGPQANERREHASPPTRLTPSRNPPPAPQGAPRTPSRRFRNLPPERPPASRAPGKGVSPR